MCIWKESACVHFVCAVIHYHTVLHRVCLCCSQQCQVREGWGPPEVPPLVAAYLGKLTPHTPSPNTSSTDYIEEVTFPLEIQMKIRRAGKQLALFKSTSLFNSLAGS